MRASAESGDDSIYNMSRTTTTTKINLFIFSKSKKIFSPCHFHEEKKTFLFFLFLHGILTRRIFFVEPFK